MVYRVVAEVTFGEYGVAYINGVEVSELIRAITGSKEGKYDFTFELVCEKLEEK